MKVKLLISRAGVSFSQTAGEVVDVDDAEGLRMIGAGQADAVGDIVETTTKAAGMETATAQAQGETTSTKKPKQTRAKT